MIRRATLTGDDLRQLVVRALRAVGDVEAVDWLEVNRLDALFDRAAQDIRGGAGASQADPELPPEADPFEGLRGSSTPMTAQAERAAGVVYGRYLAHLPAGIRGLAAYLYGAKMVDILLTVEGLGLSGIGGWRGQPGFEARVQQTMGATDPAKVLGREPATPLRTEQQAEDWLRMELATMGLSDLPVEVTVERPRFGNTWSSTLVLRGEKMHAHGTSKAEALAEAVSRPGVWSVCANELVKRAGFVFPTREEWNAQRSSAGSVTVDAREAAAQVQASRSAKAHAACTAAWTATAERYIELSKAARQVVEAIRARAAAKGRPDAATLHDAKAVTSGTPWTVTSGSKGSGFSGTRYALRYADDDRFYWDNYGRGGAGKIETYWADQTVEDLRKARANRQMIHGFREPADPHGIRTDEELREYLDYLQGFVAGKVYRGNGRGSPKAWEPPKTASVDDVLKAHTALWKRDRLVAMAAIALGIGDVTGEPYVPPTTPPVGNAQAWQARRIASDPEGWAQVLRAAASRMADARALADRWSGRLSVREAEEARSADYESSAADELPTRRDHVWMYHGTSDKFLPDILRDGLTPGHAPSNFGSKGRPDKVQRYVYLTTDATAAENYARLATTRHGGDRAVLRVRVPTSRLSVDRDDVDLSVGKYQRRIDEVRVDEIMEIDGRRTPAGERLFGGTKKNGRTAHYPYLSLATTEAAAEAAKARGVSEVARGPGGFLSAYRRAGGQASKLVDMHHASGESWTSRRAGFVARHMAQAGALWEADPEGGERPTRRHLALAVWAYSPDAARLGRWLASRG